MTAAALDVTLGIDVGTTDTKVAVVSMDGRLIAMGRRPTQWHNRPSGADADPRMLLDGVLAAAADALAEAERTGPRPAVCGIGVTGMAESGVLLDPQGKPTGPVIAWFDDRGWIEVDTLGDDFSVAFASATGLALTALPTFGKLLWRQRSQGMRSLPGCRWLNVPEYVVHALGGDQVTEPSLASRTGLLDQGSLDAFAPALDLLGAEPSLLPPLVPAGTAAGVVSGDWPAELRGAVLTVAGHDHPVASLGAGALGPDDLFDSCGTAEALIRVTEHEMTPAERLAVTEAGGAQGLHVLPGRRILLGGTRGGVLLKRTLAMLGASAPDARAAVDRSCPVGDPAPGVRFQPAPRESSLVRLQIDRDDVTPAMVWRAALERAAEDARVLADAFTAVVGPASRVVAAGGWTRLSSFRAVKRRSFPDVTFSPVDQPGVLGAAALAALAAERTDHVDTAAYLARFCAVDDVPGTHPVDRPEPEPPMERTSL
jgi:sugar (pentulose or hexulose) kinase